MSKHLEEAALLDRQRAIDLAANDAAMGLQPRVMRAFGVQIKAGKSVRTQFEAMGFDSCSVTAQHVDLLSEGEVIVVRAIERAPNCASCTVCGGDSAPGDNGLCRACRGLANVFAVRELELA